MIDFFTQIPPSNSDMTNCIRTNQILLVLLRGLVILKILYTCICDLFTQCFLKECATKYMMTGWAIVAFLRASYTISWWFAFIWTVDAKIARLTFCKYMTDIVKRICVQHSTET